VIRLLFRYGCHPPLKPMSPYWRDVVTLAIITERPHVIRQLLRIPSHMYHIWTPDGKDKDKVTVEQYDVDHDNDPLITSRLDDQLKWTPVPMPLLASDLAVATAAAAAKANQSKTILNQSLQEEAEETEPSIESQTSAVIACGMGRTIGMDGGADWPIITQPTVSISSWTEAAVYLLPFLVWAYGVDLNEFTVLAPMTHATAELLTECPYPIGSVVEMADGLGYKSSSDFDPLTGHTIFNALYITDQCEWVPMRVIDCARSPANGLLCVRLSGLKFSNVYDEWIEIDPDRIRSPTQAQLMEYETIKPVKHANESVLTFLRREKPLIMPFIEEAIQAVADARAHIKNTLLSMNVLPSVLHTIIARYAI
jgi:hypothetical protein